MLIRLMQYLERKSVMYLGKGWGTETVSKEFSQALSVLGSDQISLCIDIGGNKGLYTAEIIRNHPQANIVVFEPSEFNVEHLNFVFKDNDNVTIEPFGISDIDEETLLYSDTVGSGLASLTKRDLNHFNIKFDEIEKIRTIRFETYWRNELHSQHIDFCKIDIEGHELNALRGFGEAIKHVSLIQFEFGGCNIDTKTYLRDFWKFFEEYDFELYRISRLGPIKIPQYKESDEFFFTTNFLAKKK